MFAGTVATELVVKDVEFNTLFGKIRSTATFNQSDSLEMVPTSSDFVIDISPLIMSEVISLLVNVLGMMKRYLILPQSSHHFTKQTRPARPSLLQCLSLQYPRVHDFILEV